MISTTVNCRERIRFGLVILMLIVVFTAPLTSALELQSSFAGFDFGNTNPYKYVDPDGKTPWDIVDIGFIAYGAYQFARDPSWKRAGELGLDIGFAVLPVVPNVKRIKEGVKVLGKADDVKDVGKAGERASDVNKFKESVQRGRQAEAEILLKEGLSKNTKSFEVAVPESGKVVRTIPDSLGKSGREVIEIKDRQYVSLTGQLRAQSTLAQQRNIKPQLITGTQTRVSKPVQNRFNVNRITSLGPRRRTVRH